MKLRIGSLAAQLGTLAVLGAMALPAHAIISPCSPPPGDHFVGDFGGNNLPGGGDDQNWSLGCIEGDVGDQQPDAGDINAGFQGLGDPFASLGKITVTGQNTFWRLNNGGAQFGSITIFESTMLAYANTGLVLALKDGSFGTNPDNQFWVADLLDTSSWSGSGDWIVDWVFGSDGGNLKNLSGATLFGRTGNPPPPPPDVPEPGTLALLGLGLLGLAGARRRKD